MRRSFDGLSGIVRGEMSGQDPLSGDAFIFINRRRNQLKILVQFVWESGGFVIYHKRLEEGTFEPPKITVTGSLRWDELVLMVEGVVLKGLRRRKRYILPQRS